jgi:tetratricopeptide (TPR) repeat protein
MNELITLLPLIAIGVFPYAEVPTRAKAFSKPATVIIEEQGRNSLTGMVFDSARSPIPNLRIELLDEVESRIAITQTDSTGRYAFGNLSDGTFLVRPVTGGTNLISQSYRVQLYPAVGRGAHHEQLDLYLKTRTGVDPSASVVSPGLAFVQDVPETAQKSYERAVDLLDNKKDSESGILALQDAIKAFPTYYLALERLGLEYVRLRQYEPARTILSQALAVNSKGHGSYYALGVAQYSLKEYPASIDSLRKMLELAPTSLNAPYGHYYLGLSLLRNGKPNDAESELKKAYATGQKRVPADCHMALAQIYSNSKRYKEAADELELYLKEAPDAKDTDRIKGLIGQMRAKAK